jgi:hypothetical protein
MTIERKIIVSLDEIKALVFECREGDCRSRITLNIDEIAMDTLPRKCSNNHEWIWKISDAPSLSPFSAIVGAFKNLNAKPDIIARSRFQMFLQLDDPKSETR